jgi:hypothetical protein
MKDNDFKKILLELANMSHSQLNELIIESVRELRLSEIAIKEGFEVNK